MGDYWIFRAEFDALNEETTDEIFTWAEGWNIVRSVRTSITFRDRKKEYCLLPPIEFNNKLTGDYREVRFADILGSDYFGFCVPVTDTERNINMLSDCEISYKPGSADYQRQVREFEEGLVRLRQQAVGTKIPIGWFYLILEDRSITIRPATGGLSLFLSRNEEIIEVLKDFCRRLKPRLAGIRYEASPHFTTVFVNRGVLIPLCAWDQQSGKVPDTRIYPHEKASFCLYQMRRGEITMLADLLERIPRPLGKERSRALRSLFGEDGDAPEVLVNQKEVAELANIFFHIHHIFSPPGFMEIIYRRISARAGRDIEKEIAFQKENLSREEYHLVASAYFIASFLRDVVNKGYDLRIIREDYRDLS